MKMLNLIIAENKKEFIYIKNYVIENVVRTINLFVLFTVVFFATGYFGKSASTFKANDIVTFQLIGYSYWIVAMSCMDVFTGAVREDAEIGVLESMALSGYGLIAIFMSRTVSRLIMDMLVVSSIWILVIAITPVGIKLINLPMAFIVLIITTVGLYGVGLTLAGIALTLKRVSAVQALLNYFFLFASGIFIPASVLPAPFAASKYYLPLTVGIDLARKLLLGTTDRDFIRWFAWLIILSSIYFITGVYLFKYFENIAKKKGALASY